MISMLFKRTAQAGLIAANTVLAAPSNAALDPGASSIDRFSADRMANAPQAPSKPDLYACMIKAALDTAQKVNGKTDGTYFEYRFKDDDGSDTKMVSAIRGLDTNWNAGPMIFLKADREGSGSIVVKYVFAAAGDVKLANPATTVTTVELDKDDLTGYTGLDTESGKDAVGGRNEQIIHDNALYTAQVIVKCMNAGAGLSVDLK